MMDIWYWNISLIKKQVEVMSSFVGTTMNLLLYEDAGKAAIGLFKDDLSKFTMLAICICI